MTDIEYAVQLVEYFFFATELRRLPVERVAGRSFEAAFANGHVVVRREGLGLRRKISRLMQNPMGLRRCLAGRDARREPQTNSMTIRKARNKADRPAKHRPEGFARKVPSCGVARLVE